MKGPVLAFDAVRAKGVKLTRIEPGKPDGAEATGGAAPEAVVTDATRAPMRLEPTARVAPPAAHVAQTEGTVAPIPAAAFARTPATGPAPAPSAPHAAAAGQPEDEATGRMADAPGARRPTRADLASAYAALLGLNCRGPICSSGWIWPAAARSRLKS
jgi:hypothetical protein